ncbi:hypothetical protein SAMN05421819_0269 [Bryocella elongata]|uniref:Carboxypeptidase regulatory-like domain-containing protein n=1 Tax=Bryocella elongata TaxID=863522 RepID=A0A1H5SPC1_9BACT|nr:hypothetical protein [Bryocella elongata]SEF51691.1 hypothetical protein SAMN05421819_0269 [Bryocella elongata]
MYGPGRITPSLRLLALLLSLPLLAHASGPVTGNVTNRTVGKPSAGDTVTLLKLTTGMEEVISTTTDAHGHFKLDVPDDAMHLIRVTHDKASYFAPLQPTTHDVTVDVYDAAPVVAGVSTTVQELHVETSADKLQVVEVIQVTNQSQPAKTQFGPKGYDFYLPPNAHIVRTVAMRDQLPVPATATPVGDANHYTFIFPIRPGETQFGIFYDLPYNGKAEIPLHIVQPVATLAVLLPPSVTFKSGRGANFAQQAASADNGNAQTWTATQIAGDSTLSFSISGTGSLQPQGPAQGSTPGGGAPAEAGAPSGGADPGQAATADTRPGGGLGNPLDPNGDRDPWGKYKWFILGGFVLLLAIGAGFMLRAPSGTDGAQAGSAQNPVYASPLQPHRPAAPISSDQHILSAMKEELFALETERLQKHISEDEYLEHKAALEAVLRRALNRSSNAAAGQPDKADKSSGPTTPTGAA